MTAAGEHEQFKELQARVQLLEDESIIRKVVLAYGPAADAGLSNVAASLWTEDGIYDWDAGREPRGRDEIEAMLDGDIHRKLMAEGVAHFAGPLFLDVDGDRATALNYSLIMRREADRFYLWRVTAVRWELVRTRSSWRVQRRTNRVLDDSGAGSRLFGDSLTDSLEGRQA